MNSMWMATLRCVYLKHADSMQPLTPDRSAVTKCTSTLSASAILIDRPNLFHQFQFGQGMTQSTALTGDWDGDGIDTVGLWHAASQQFLLTNQHGTNAGTFSVAASVTSPDAMPFSLKGPGKISRLGLHLWRDGLLTLPDTEETVSYGIPGLLGLPVFQ